jgi:type II secretory pathway pseudopilin PulG
MRFRKPSGGFTLIECIVVTLGLVALIAVPVAGKAIWDTRKDTSDVLASIQGIAEAAKSATNRDYGTGSLVTLLNTSRAFNNSPRYRVTVTAGVATVTNQYNAAVTVVGGTTNIIYSESGVPEGVCAGVTPRLQPTMWTTVRIGAAAVRTIPIPADQAATDCAGLAGGAIVLTTVA